MSSKCVPHARCKACAVAHSKAALLLNPEPIGTVLRISNSTPRAFAPREMKPAVTPIA